MKNWIVLILGFLFISSSYADFYGKVVRVIDGDTIVVLKDRKQVRVRLYGIDAPESRQAHGQRAKQFLSSKITGKQVKIVDKGNDVYKRLLGYVIYNNVNINGLMVSEGYAWAYAYKNRYIVPSFKTAQDQAKRNRKGLWRDKNPINPYQFRKMNRK